MADRVTVTVVRTRTAVLDRRERRIVVEVAPLLLLGGERLDARFLAQLDAEPAAAVDLDLERLEIVDAAEGALVVRDDRALSEHPAVGLPDGRARYPDEPHPLSHAGRLPERTAQLFVLFRPLTRMGSTPIVRTLNF